MGDDKMVNKQWSAHTQNPVYTWSSIYRLHEWQHIHILSIVNSHILDPPTSAWRELLNFLTSVAILQKQIREFQEIQRTCYNCICWS